MSHIRQASEVLETIVRAVDGGNAQIATAAERESVVRVSAQIQGEVQQLNSQLGHFRT